MREALDNTDGCGGIDNVIRQAASLYLSDDYKEVCELMFSFSSRIINQIINVC